MIGKIIKKTASLILILTLIGIIFTGGVYIYFRNKIDFSGDERLFEYNRVGNVTRFYYDEDLSDSVYTPIEFYELDPGGDKKIWFSYDEIGDNLKNAFISVEDRKFFKHKGIDVKRTAYAVLNYFTKSKPSFGASTITQQVIKNISGDDDKTPSRKISEIIRALHIEKQYTKEEIFEVYLNIVPMGEGVAGVGLASENYFGKTPDMLTLAEAATIAGITNAPSKFNPRINADECLKRRNSVLFSMLESHAISEEEYNKAVNEVLYVTERKEDEGINSWFIETVIEDVTKQLVMTHHISEATAKIMIQNGGLSIHTTINPKIQDILEGRFENLEQFPTSVNNGLNYSMVVTDSKNGYLLGIVGSVGIKSANRILNYATIPETPGSAIKPLSVYAPLLDSGKVNWATVFDDTPFSFSVNDAGEYVPYPRNYPNVYDGLITLSDALRLSKNTVAIKMLNMSDKRKIFELLRNKLALSTLAEGSITDKGITVTDIADAPLALGQLSYGVSLRKLTEAYTVFPRDGAFSDGKSFISVYDPKGNLILDNGYKKEEQVFKRETARIMNKLLMRVTESGTAKLITLDETVDTAGKTGTSGNDKDRMFIGYTPYYTAGIWCGYSDNSKSIGNQSISHIEIWDEVMKNIHESCIKSEIHKSFSEEGLYLLPYCMDSGEKYTEICALDPRGERIDYGYFTFNNKPDSECRRHVECLYDELAGGVAVGNCPNEYLINIALLNIPDRSFPCDIYITDAEYVWRKMSKSAKVGDSYDVPFFVYDIPDGEYVGRSKNKKQYNSSCYIHDD